MLRPYACAISYSLMPVKLAPLQPGFRIVVGGRDVSIPEQVKRTRFRSRLRRGERRKRQAYMQGRLLFTLILTGFRPPTSLEADFASIGMAGVLRLVLAV